MRCVTFYLLSILAESRAWNLRYLRLLRRLELGLSISKCNYTMSQLVTKIQRQADTNAGRFMSSRQAWGSGNLDLGVVRIVIPGWRPTQLV